ncbi:MAG TPA: C-terminal helicase domain-containing protein, partial [Bacteroidota bacterium]|nr:C-terminal helicase domain-containing protein [Bacteroidota bacterium]
FKQGRFKVMVATDIAARGIDVEGISHVINYDTPSFAEDYIHRIGRTGRASATGDAITFVGNDERNYFKKIERYTEKQFDLAPYPGFERSKKTPATEHSAEEHSSREQHGERPREERHDHSRSHSGPKHDEGHRERSQGGFRRDDRPRGFSEHKPQRNNERRDDKPRGFSERKPQRNDDRRGRRERPQGGGFPRHGQHNDSHNQPPRGSEYPRKRSTFVDSSKAKTPAPETDWRSLVESMSEERGGSKLKKKLKRIFTRDKE